MSQPCRNGAECVDLVNNFRCNCKPGYAGRVCEVNINECLLQPCKNNGTCLDGVNDYNCVCQPGLYTQFLKRNCKRDHIFSQTISLSQLVCVRAMSTIWCGRGKCTSNGNTNTCHVLLLVSTSLLKSQGEIGRHTAFYTVNIRINHDGFGYFEPLIYVFPFRLHWQKLLSRYRRMRACTL